jgi:hypothetical protein
MDIEFKSLITLCAFLVFSAVNGAEVKTELNDDELVSLARFELLHKMACQANDSEMFAILLQKKTKEKFSLVGKNKFQEIVNEYPEVIGISLVLELSREDYTKLVGTRVTSLWLDPEEVGVRYFKVNFKLLNNGSAPNYIILKNGVFYKAAL